MASGQRSYGRERPWNGFRLERGSSRCEASRRSGDAISRDARLACKQGNIEFVRIIRGTVARSLVR